MLIVSDGATPRLRRAIAVAEETAGRDGRPVGSTDLLLGMLAEGTGAAPIALARLGVDRAALEAALAASASAGSSIVSAQAGQAAIDMAEQEATERGHHYLGQEHLLLAILREPEGSPADVLARFDVTYDRVAAELSAMFS